LGGRCYRTPPEHPVIRENPLRGFVSLLQIALKPPTIPSVEKPMTYGGEAGIRILRATIYD
jgi:hypothetical protein